MSLPHYGESFTMDSPLVRKLEAVSDTLRLLLLLSPYAGASLTSRCTEVHRRPATHTPTQPRYSARDQMADLANLR